jgi:predicted dienelactone hydrolase
MLRSRTTVLAAILLLLAALGGCGDSQPIQPASQDELASPGPYAVATAEFRFVDASRPTPANGSYAGAAERTLPTTVWYPAAAAGGTAPAGGGPFPLIGYAHGYLSSRGEAPELKTHLASHGYVVVAPDFPLSNGGAPGGPTFADVAHQPGDLAFVMDAVAHLSGDGAALSAAIDVAHRGIAGLSLGGGTTLIAAFHPTLHLSGVAAAVAFAPASCFFGPGLYRHSLPTMILSGSSDELVPFDTGPARAFEFAPAPITLVRLHGGTHVGFIGIDVPSAQNSDEVVGCSAVQSAGTGGLDALAADLTNGAGADAVDPAPCGAGVCSEKFVQTMRAARQLELTKIATLAHFEATLRGRRDAARFIEVSLAAGNSDLDVAQKR